VAAGEKLNTYVGTYLDQEVKKEAAIRKLDGFQRFLELLLLPTENC